MGRHELAHLTQMLEQIAANFSWESDEERAASAVAAHLRRFWSPEMRAQVVSASAAHDIELSPLAGAAVRKLA
jgi:formate dehydrogenase subunit delta